MVISFFFSVLKDQDLENNINTVLSWCLCPSTKQEIIEIAQVTKITKPLCLCLTNNEQ